MLGYSSLLHFKGSSLCPVKDANDLRKRREMKSFEVSSSLVCFLFAAQPLVYFLFAAHSANETS